MSLVAAVMASQAGALQQQVANSVLKSNLDSEKSTVLTLLGAGPSLGNVGAGVGGNLDVSA